MSLVRTLLVGRVPLRGNTAYRVLSFLLLVRTIRLLERAALLFPQGKPSPAIRSFSVAYRANPLSSPEGHLQSP
jgi:hypothetical protein